MARLTDSYAKVARRIRPLRFDLVLLDGLGEQLDIDALLMGDLSSILRDKRSLMSPRLECGLRFSVAHEIGHLVLHRDIYAGFNCKAALVRVQTRLEFDHQNRTL